MKPKEIQAVKNWANRQMAKHGNFLLSQLFWPLFSFYGFFFFPWYWALLIILLPAIVYLPHLAILKARTWGEHD